MGYAEDFFKKYKDLSMKASQQLKGVVPASVILSQALIESTSGKGGRESELATKYNNKFGMTASNAYIAAGGKYVSMPTGEYDKNGKHYMTVRNFRRYDSAEESFLDYAANLQKTKSYGNAGLFQAGGNPEKAAKAIANGGYATNPNYFNDIMSNIKKYSLSLMTAGDIQIDPNWKPPATNPGGVIGDVFGNPGESDKDAHDRENALNPPTDIPGAIESVTDGLKDWGTGIFKNGLVAIIIILLAAVMIVVIVMTFKNSAMSQVTKNIPLVGGK